MNIALEKTVEYVNGEVRNKYGDVFIRGNNGLSLLPPAWLCVVIIRGILIDVWISAIYLPGCGIGGVRSMDRRRKAFLYLSLSLF